MKGSWNEGWRKQRGGGCGEGVPCAGGREEGGVGGVGSAVRRLHDMAERGAGEGRRWGECDEEAAGVLEEEAGGDAGRDAVADGPEESWGDELSRRDGGMGAG